MTDDLSKTPGGSDDHTASGEGQGKGNEGHESSQGSTTEDKVAYSSYQKLLAEKKALADRYREQQETLSKIEAERKEAEKKKLEEQGNYKKLLEQERQEREKLANKLKQTEERETGRRKLASVIKSVGGEIDPKFYDLIDYDEVIVDPETGEVDKLSVTNVVEKIRATYPEIIRAKGGPGMSQAAPKGANGAATISYDEWRKLPVKEMDKWKSNQIID